MTAVGDLCRDWRRWSATERVCAMVFGVLWATGVTTAILADAHLLSSSTITRLWAPPTSAITLADASIGPAATPSCGDRQSQAC